VRPTKLGSVFAFSSALFVVSTFCVASVLGRDRVLYPFALRQVIFAKTEAWVFVYVFEKFIEFGS
jgi:hypothetical protein